MQTKTKKNTAVRWCGKALLSGILAFVILTLACMLYYNLPVHYSCTDGATDYRWESHKFYSTWKEGFAWGRTNNEGYMNGFDYTPETKLRVLILGSSHMEGRNVAMDESTAALLNEKLGNESVYNLGLSSHDFLACASNLDAAVEKYAPSEYVIMEASTFNFDSDRLQAVIDGSLPEVESRSEGILALLQKNQYIRLLYKQLSYFGVDFFGGGAGEAEAVSADPAPEADNEALLAALLEKLGRTAEEHGVKLIIMYHPSTGVDEKGRMVQGAGEEHISMVASACEKNGITFLDMSERFAKGYEESSILPHGFSNTSTGSGHLNRDGHAMIAEELYRLMKEGGGIR